MIVNKPSWISTATIFLCIHVGSRHGFVSWFVTFRGCKMLLRPEASTCFMSLHSFQCLVALIWGKNVPEACASHSLREALRHAHKVPLPKDEVLMLKTTLICFKLSNVTKKENTSWVAMSEQIAALAHHQWAVRRREAYYWKPSIVHPAVCYTQFTVRMFVGYHRMPLQSRSHVQLIKLCCRFWSSFVVDSDVQGASTCQFATHPTMLSLVPLFSDSSSASQFGGQCFKRQKSEMRCWASHEVRWSKS